VSVIVQKYGGSSLATAAHIKRVARRIGSARERHAQIVVVVSAMGDTTDELIALAHAVAAHPDPRELDLLKSTGETVSVALMAMALKDLGYSAIALTGGQAGIQTEARYGRARILAVNPKRVRQELNRGNIVVVAGFQGVTEDMDVTTLGRGASDLTAVALAAALGAERCEIYTDVAGVYTADPRVVPAARLLKDLNYEEMLEMASQGARVLQPRAVELAALYHVPILVASSFTEGPGTLIHGGVTMESARKVRGVTHDPNVAKITVLGVPDRPGIAAALFEPLAQAGISVDIIVQNASTERLTDLTFTVTREDLATALETVRPVSEAIGARGLVSDDFLGKVSIVGTGMQNAPGYAARMFRALADAGINIEMITTSEIRITCVVARDRLEEAVRVLHSAFELDVEEAS
jgi:aspartate kinase